MAAIPFTPLQAGPGFQLIVWEDLGAADEGVPFDSFANAAGMGYSKFTVQTEGMFAGASVHIAGCVIPGKFNVMEEFSYSDLKSVLTVGSIKPIIVGGDDDTKIAVGLLVTR